MADTILLSFVQAVTEFLPVSSSGHLLIMKQILGIDGTDIMIDVLLHVSSLGVVGVFLACFLKDAISNRHDAIRLGIFLGVTSLVTGALGLLVSQIVAAMATMNVLGINYCVLGVGLLGSKWLVSRDRLDRSVMDMNWVDAVFVGTLQGLSVFPGISRSGIVLLGLLALRFRLGVAFYVTFLLAIPVVLGSATFKFFEVPGGIERTIRLDMVWGTLIILALGLPILLLFRKLVLSGWLYAFGGYCLVLGGGVLGFLWLW